MYDLTYLGHAGFMLETDKYIFIMDPWVTRQGAYDNSWFQFPCNHHLEDMLVDKVYRTEKPVYLYISHEHKDHWDPRLIKLFGNKPILLLPRFRRSFLRDQYQDYGGKLHVFTDNQMMQLPGNSFVEFYIHDSVREADSALLINYEGCNFLNMNDCHIHDRLDEIQEVNGRINIFTGHFSGASWFPTCYMYSDELQAKKAKKNMYARFVTMSKALEKMKPDYYIPSAGPVCFLDPSLWHINFQEDNIFPLPGKFYHFLGKSMDLDETAFVQLQPGDTLDTNSIEDRVDYHPDLQAELEEYQEEITDILAVRKAQAKPDWEDVSAQLMENLNAKLEAFPLHNDLANFDVRFNLVSQQQNQGVAIDFANKTTHLTDSTIPQGRVKYLREVENKTNRTYSFYASGEEYASVASGKLTWYEWLLSFRFQIHRSPDEFNSLLDGFLVNEASELPAFCEHYEQRKSEETLEVEFTNEAKLHERYKICRYCPHEGADLSNGYVDKRGNLVCPKHSWRFNLRSNGECREHCATINAERIDD